MANNLSAFNAQAWSKKLIENLDQLNIMLPLVNSDYEGELQQVGDTVFVRTLSSISMSPYTGSITYTDLAPVKESFQVLDAQHFAFKVDDLEKAQSDLEIMNSYTSRAAVGMSNTVEAKLLAQYANAHSANKITGASNAAITLTKDNVYEYFVQARTKLAKQNVPAQGRWSVVDPDTTALLLQSSQFIRATDLGDRVITEADLGAVGRPGFIGRCAGFDIYESNQVAVVSSAKYLMFGTRMAISYAAKIVEMEAIRLQDSFSTAVRGLLLHDAKVFAEPSKALVTVKAAA